MPARVPAARAIFQIRWPVIRRSIDRPALFTYVTTNSGPWVAHQPARRPHSRGGSIVSELTEPPVRHEGEHRPLPERAAVQERPDRRPSRHSRHPSLTAWTREPLHRIAHDLVTADHPLSETAQRRHAQPNRAGLELAVRQIVLIAPTHLLGKMREQRRASHVLHDKRQEIPETPSIGSNRRWGRSFFDPEKVTKFLEQGGQAHRLPPRVRHALRRSMGPGDPWINRESRWTGLIGRGRGAQNWAWP